jgi:hypothetical protein
MHSSTCDVYPDGDDPPSGPHADPSKAVYELGLGWLFRCGVVIYEGEKNVSG